MKSGDSYGKTDDDGLILKAQAKNLAQRTSHSICLIWIDRKLNKIFWAYIHPLTLKGSTKYGVYHIVSPAVRYDLARCQAKNLPYKTGGIGIILSKASTNLKVRRRKALNKYRNLHGKGVLCPNLGIVDFTRIGWRHMFRKGRSAKNKSSSLDVIMYIDMIMTDLPTDIYISNCEFFTQSEFAYRKTEYVLNYDKVKYFDKHVNTLTNTNVVVRLIEEIRWPEDWKVKGVLSQMVERKVVLLSCYNK